MFRSATFRLTLWYLAIVIVISLLFSVVLYHDASLELSRGLHRESARIYSQFPVFQNSPLLQPKNDISSAEHRLLLRLALFNVAVLFGAGFTSYFLARRTLRPIEEAHEQQKRFTADVSHELRTPLTAIRMESEVALLADADTPELQATIKSNLEEVAKLEQLINNLLRLTRLEATELQGQFQAVLLNDILAASLARVARIAKKRNIIITPSFPDDVNLMADPESLSQLFIILFENAIKYSSHGSTITIHSQKQGERAIIEVRDYGIGISKADLDHVFDRFYRADNSRNKTTTEGFGLGLSIAKMIADLHSATITLASREGRGTIASVELPILAGPSSTK